MQCFSSLTHAVQTLKPPHVCVDSMIEFLMLSLCWDHSTQMTVLKGRTNLKLEYSQMAHSSDDKVCRLIDRRLWSILDTPS